MTAGCACCGSCCDPVPFYRDQYDDLMLWSSRALGGVPDPGTDEGWAHWLANGWEDAYRETAAWRYDPAGNWRENADFIASHWTPDGDNGCKCDAFDPAAALCTAQDAKPPVCREYPWYGDEPAAERAADLHLQCSYLADVAPSERPEGSRPLIPLTVITRREAA